MTNKELGESFNSYGDLYFYVKSIAKSSQEFNSIMFEARKAFLDKSKKT